MASIDNPVLTVTTDSRVDCAMVVVTCDVEFTEVKVNAMDLLGLQYVLTGEVLNKDLLDEDPVLRYRKRTFPHVRGDGRWSEHVLFERVTYMDVLHDRLISKDRLVAKLTMTNQETQAQVTARTDVIKVDLAA